MNSLNSMKSISQKTNSYYGTFARRDQLMPYLFLSGGYTSSLTFYDSTNITIKTLTNSNAGFNDVYVASYSKTGVINWTTRIAGAYEDYPKNLLLDSLNNVYITGYYTDSTLTLYNSDTSIFKTLTNAGSNDIFLAKYNSNGIGQWVTRIGGTGGDTPVNLFLDSTNNVYISGTCQNVTFYNSDNTTFKTLTIVGVDGFVAKYNSNGIGQWVIRIGGTGVEAPVNLLVDSTNNVYISGTYSANVILYNSNDTTFNTFTNVGNYDFFIAKYNNNGIGQWAARIAGTGNDTPVNLLLDLDNNVYISGTSTSTMTIYNSDTSTFITWPFVSGTDTFLAKYDNIYGYVVWANRIIAVSTERPINLLVDSDNNVYISGIYTRDVTLYNSDTSSFTTLIKSGSIFLPDIFIAKYDTDGYGVWATRIAGGDNDFPVNLLLDSSNNVYVSGYYASDVTIYNRDTSSFITLKNDGDIDTFIAKYNSNGFGVLTNKISGTGTDRPVNLLVDSTNNVYISGYYTANLTLYNSFVSKMITNAGGSDIYISNYNNNSGIINWITTISSTGSDIPVNLLVDSTNNVYISGTYTANVTLYNSNSTIFTTLTNAGSNDIFIAKYNSNGIGQWATRIAGTGTDQPVNFLLDSTNNVYISGYYNANITLYNRTDTTTSSFRTLTIAGGNDIFIAKYNSDGFGVWTTRIVDISNNQPIKLLVDTINNVYISGYYSANLTLYNSDTSTFTTLTNAGSYDIFVAKYNSDGRGVWATRIAGTDSDQPVNLLLDSTNNVYISGIYSSSILKLYNSDSTTFNILLNVGGNDSFIAKYNTNGMGVFTNRLAGTGTDQPVNLLLDSTNNVYISGYYSADLTLYNSTFGIKLIPNSGSNDTYFFNYDNNGLINWTIRISSTGEDLPVVLLLDSTNNVYISGFIGAGVTLYNSDSTTFKTITTFGNNDVFIAKYNSNGIGVWATRLGGTTGDRPLNALLDSANNLYISGYYFSKPFTLYSSDINDTGFVTLTNSGNTDIFIAKYDSNGIGVWATNISGTGSEISVKLLLDSTNNVYISGYYNSTLSFYNSDYSPVITLTNSGGNDTFIAKYDNNGIGVWATRIAGTGTDQPVNLILDSRDNVYIYGYYSADVTLYNSNTTTFNTLSNAGGNDIFIAKYNTNGICILSNRISGTTVDQPVNFLLDSSDNPYISGYYNTDVTLYNSNFGGKTIINAGGSDIHISNYDNDGLINWITRISSTGTDIPVNLLVDSTNNVYISGTYTANLTLYNTTDTTTSTFKTLTNSGGSDTFIAKYNSSGIGVWATRISGTGSEIPVNLLLDSTNNVYISGTYSANVTLYNSDTSGFKTLTISGGNDIFIAKYNTSGIGVWATRISGAGSEIPVNLLVDSTNNVYISGYYSANVTLYSSAGTSTSSFKTLTNSGSNDTFIAKYNSSGIGVWATMIAGTGTDQPVNLLLDSTNNVYISGYYSANVTLYSSADTTTSSFKTLTNSGSNDSFIAKYDNSGNGVWATRIVDVSNNQPINLLVDSMNNVYISGYYGSYIKLYNSNTTSFKMLTNAGGNDIFVAKYDSSGNGVWATTISGTGTDKPVNLILDSSNNVYISGYYTTDITLYNSSFSGKTITNAGGSDIYIFNYYNNGLLNWTTCISGIGNEVPIFLLSDSSKNVYISGYYGSTITLYNSDTSTFKTITNAGGIDTFIAKYDNTGIGIWATQITDISNNQTVNLLLDSTNNAYISGYYTADITLYNSNTSTFKTLTNAGGIDTFIAKYDSSGNGLWVTSIASKLTLTNWIAIDSNRKWSSVSMSSSGQYQTAVVDNGKIYISSDYGITWTEKYNNSFYKSVAMSTSGQYQTVVGFYSYVTTSNDYGNTWTNRNLYLNGTDLTLFLECNSISMSSSGNLQYITTRNGKTWKSYTYGQTWEIFGWTTVEKPDVAAMSSSGDYITTVTYGGTIYVSGPNFSGDKESIRNWISVCMSSSGQYQTAIAYGDQIYISSDYGYNWTATESNRNWSSVCMSSSGDYQIAVASSDKIYISSDYGYNWTATESNRNWSSVCMSSKSEYRTAVVSNGQIYTSKIIVNNTINKPVNLLLDSTNNVYISGYYNASSLTLYNSNSTSFKTLTNSGSNDTFVAKYDNTGFGVWASIIAGTGTDQPVNLLLDSTNNVYISGFFDGLLIPGSVPIFKTLTNSGQTDTFIAKYDNSGIGQWATRITGTGSSPVNLLVDSTNNVYISGYYGSTITLYNSDSSTFNTLTNYSQSYTFISKYNSNGICIWANNIPNTSNNQSINMILGSSNNILISGCYVSDLLLYYNSFGKLSYNYTPPIFKTFTNIGDKGNEIFITKYNSEGSGIWATSIGSNNHDQPINLLLDSSKNVYISGYYTANVTLYNSNNTSFKTLFNGGGNDTFIAKYDNIGNGVWATSICSGSTDQPVNLLLDSRNNVYISGYYTADVILYNSNDTNFKTLTNLGSNDTFIAKYDSSGIGVWASRIAGTGTDRPVNLLLDSTNNVYISGYYTAEMMFYYNNLGKLSYDNPETNFKTLINSGGSDVFIAKYDSSGNGIWATQIADISNNQPINLLLDSKKNVYISGYYTSNTTLYNSASTSFKTLTNVGGNNTFVAKYDSSGNGVWATRITDASNNQSVNLLLDSKNNVYISGYYNSTLTLFNSTDTSFNTLVNTGDNDMFIAKYDSSGIGVWSTNFATTGSDQPVNLLLDSIENVYISGYYGANKTLYYDNLGKLNITAPIFKTLTNSGGNDTFVAKYDSSGNGLWATRITDAGNNQPVSMALKK